jgi:hypothetical protein
MIEAGIMDGDHVVIRRTDTADNGAIVVALVDGNEATLKLFATPQDGVALVPPTPLRTRFFEAGRVRCMASWSARSALLSISCVPRPFAAPPLRRLDARPFFVKVPVCAPRSKGMFDR